MKTNSEGLYLLLGQHIIEMPDFSNQGPLSGEQSAWLGRACSLVEASGAAADTQTIKACADSMKIAATRPDNTQAIGSILYRALAKAVLPSK